MHRLDRVSEALSGAQRLVHWTRRLSLIYHLPHNLLDTSLLHTVFATNIWQPMLVITLWNYLPPTTAVRHADF